jgi:hypothetical protein
MSDTVHVDTFNKLLKLAKESPNALQPHEVAMLAAYAEMRIAELECQVLIARHADPSDRSVKYVPVFQPSIDPYKEWRQTQPTCEGGTASDGKAVPQQVMT